MEDFTIQPDLASHCVATELTGFKKQSIKQASMAHTAHKTSETAAKKKKKNQSSLDEKKEKKYIRI